VDEKNVDVCAVILAGGKSSRMGRRKELLDWVGRPLILHQVDAVRRAGLSCLIVSNAPDELPDQVSVDPQVTVIEDAWTSKGPITGILSAMEAAEYGAYLVLSCDLPFLAADHLLHMLRFLPELKEWDALIAEAGGRLHPLIALYHRRTKAVWQQALALKEYRVMAAVERIKSKPLQADWLDDWVTFNMNTPEEYEIALREWRRRDALFKRNGNGGGSD
jgi:molybdopterin-guanine dinucleotide biosynthesis protein A